MKKSSAMSSYPKTKLPDRHQLRLSRTGWIRLRALASLGMILGLGAAGTLASWSTSVNAATGMFSTGSIEMKLNGQRPTYAFTALNQINLAQGGSTAGMLPVQNTGMVNFTYVASATTTDAGTASYGSASAATLASNLTLSAFSGGSVTGSAGSETCTGGTLIDTAKSLSTTGPVNFITTPQAVATSTAQNLCIQIKLNPAAPIGARMSAVNVAMQFTATSS
jgi:predicted ribosomally synthesized peptide with SipW-like signal peptide